MGETYAIAIISFSRQQIQWIIGHK